MLHKLAELGSKPICADFDVGAFRQSLQLPECFKQDLLRLLKLKNGFYAFESALHVFPFSDIDVYEQQDLLRWNSPDLWKSLYGADAEGLFCFAEDVFGY